MITLERERFSVTLLHEGHVLAEEAFTGEMGADDSSRLVMCRPKRADGFLQRKLPSCRPPRRERLGLLQDGLHRGVLKIRRIAVLAEDAFDKNSHARPCRLPVLPIH